MNDALTYAIELAVGLASCAGAVAVRRASGLGWLAGLLLLAGLAACVHAVLELTG